MKIKALSYMECVKFVYEQHFRKTKYALISIQESAPPVLIFNTTKYLSDVLYLYFDDAREFNIPIENVKYFSIEDAKSIIEFVSSLQVKLLIVHCYAGVSRSVAIKKVLDKYINGEDTPIGSANPIVYDILDKEFQKKLEHTKNNNGTPLECSMRHQCIEGPTCTAHLAEGRAFECRVLTMEDYDKLEYKCDVQYELKS